MGALLATVAVLLLGAAPSPSPRPVDAERALQIARKAVAEVRPAAGFVVLQEKTEEKDFGWVFFYQPKRYVETGDRDLQVPGNGPLVVHRSDGSTRFLSSSLPPDKAIAEYEKQWRRRRGRRP